MAIWSDTYLSQLVGDAEEEISRRINCLFARIPISIVSGQAVYDLPDRFNNVAWVSWLGRQLAPLSALELRAYDAAYLSTPGTPYWYSLEKDGTNKIRFYPIPNVSVGQGGAGTFDPVAFHSAFDNSSIAVTTNGAYGTSLGNLVTLSYFYSVDPNNTVLSIPRWIARRMIKEYVLFKSFAQEGKGQNLKKSDYHRQKFEAMVIRFKTINSGVNANARPSNSSEFFQRSGPRLPLLPSNFGYNRSPR